MHNPVVLNFDRLTRIKNELDQANCEKFHSALAHLISRADQWLLEGPWTVTSKALCPPSGDCHDYVSQALYWWPSHTPDHLPYVMRDGEPNPETLKDDKLYRAKMFQSTYTLSLAWYYTRRPNYATHAAHILRTWFIDPETCMNPNLNHAQLILGVNNGRPLGIIDFSQGYSTVLDASAILSLSSAWTKADQHAFIQWNNAYLKWLIHSDFGIEESKKSNNHGTFATMQIAAIALFVGDKDLAINQAEGMKSRINSCIKPDGSQPYELSRTRSWHYSCYNLVALARIAEVGSKVGVDLWGYEGSNGQSLHKAINYLIPSATGMAEWQHPETTILRWLASDIIRASANVGNAMARAAEPQLEVPDLDFWPLRQSPENLDSLI